MRKKVLIAYLIVLFILITSTLEALLDGGYQIAGGIIASIAFGSVITSLVPYYIAIYFFKKYEEAHFNKIKYKIFGLVFFSFCFPVKIWIIFSNLSILIIGGERWAFG